VRRAVLLALLVEIGVAAQAHSANRQLALTDLEIQAPVLVRKVEPAYTEEARRAKVEGSVLLYVEVGVDGRAHDIRVIRGLGFGLDRQAIEAVRQWRFRPGIKNGLPANTPATIEVQFHLDAERPSRI
jgi:TonB family protein